MEDLIARANKYAQGAGETQEGQRWAAERYERVSQWMGWLSTALSAVVGTSIFAKWIETDPIPFGLAAIGAAALTALQRASKLDERADVHRGAGAEYGGLRRQADMLQLRLKGGDITREKGLAELDQLGKELSELAKKVRTLPDSIYKPAASAFKEAHKKYYQSVPTHAGGVVVRRENDTTQYLIIQTKAEPREWVLPKGHIRHGESLEQAARREVLEETGVETAVRDVLDIVEFSTPNGRVKGQFFLMEAIREGQPREGRKRKWLIFDEAVRELQYKEAQRLVCQAYVTLRNTTEVTGL